MANVEDPSSDLAQARLLRNFLKRSFAGIVPERDAAAIGGVIKIIGQHTRVFKVEQVDRLEIIAEKQIEIAVIVIIERDHSDGVSEFVQARGGAHIFEFSIALVVIKDRSAEAGDEQV